MCFRDGLCYDKFWLDFYTSVKKKDELIEVTTKTTNMAWGDHETEVLLTLQLMREQKFLTDITIECNGKEFAAHRAILCAAIPFFYTMYQAGMEEAKTNKVHLQTITPEAMAIVLDFVYTGKASSFSGDIKLYEDVLHATHLLQIDGLFKIYTEGFMTHLSTTHFARIFSGLELYDNESLAYIVTYLTTNFFQISASDDFRQLSVSQIKLLLSHHELKTVCTDVVAQGILRWVKFSENERSNDLEDLFSFISVDKISLPYLQVLLNRESLIKRCQPLFNKLVSAVLEKLNEVYSDSKIICFGREDLHDLEMDRVTTYNLQKRTWSLEEDLPFDVESGMGVVQHMGHVYFFGGYCREYRPSTSVYKYNPALNEVVQLKDLVVPVTLPGIGTLNDQFYIVGGQELRGDTLATTKTVLRVDPDNGDSVLVAPTIELHKSPFVTGFQSKIYIVGTEHGESSAVERYSPQTDQWTIVTTVPEDVDRSHATLWKDQLVVLCNPQDDRLYFYNFSKDYWDWISIPRDAPCEDFRGMWSTTCKRHKKPVILFQDTSSMLHFFDPEVESWKSLHGRVPLKLYSRMTVLMS